MHRKWVALIVAVSIIIIVAVAMMGYFAWKKVPQTSAPTSVTQTSTSTSGVMIGRTSINLESIQELQSAVDQGHQPWRLDPQSVAIVDSSIYPNGLATRDGSLESIQQISLNLQTGVAAYILPFQGKQYEVAVIQPVVGKRKVWVVSDIEDSSLFKATTSSFVFLTPVKNDSWNIGQSHEIFFNQPIPYDSHCVNAIYLLDPKGNQVGALNISGDNIPLEKGELSVAWDAKTLWSSYCGTGNTSFDVKPGTYRLELHDEDAGYGIGKPIDIFSDYFKLQ